MVPMSSFNLVKFQPLFVIENLPSLRIRFLHDAIAFRVQGGNAGVMIMNNLIQL